MKTALLSALLSALWLAFGLAATFYLLPIIEDGIRLAFDYTLTAARWIRANPEQFSFWALFAFAVLMVVSINRANAPKGDRAENDNWL